MRYKRDDGHEGEDVREIRGFKLVPVFDISQTEGPELPDVASKLEGLAPEGVFERLTEFAHSIGFHVERPESLMSGANGDTTHSSGLIRVVSANSETQQAKTLAHEIGHALLHDPESATTKDLSRWLKELEAESTAYVICTVLGMDSRDYSFGHVLGWTGGAPDAIEGIKSSTGRIQRAATAVLRTFEMEVGTGDADQSANVEVAPVREVPTRDSSERLSDVEMLLHLSGQPVEERIQPRGDGEETRASNDLTKVSAPDQSRRDVPGGNYQPLSEVEIAFLDTPVQSDRHFDI